MLRPFTTPRRLCPTADGKIQAAGFRLSRMMDGMPRQTGETYFGWSLVGPTRASPPRAGAISLLLALALVSPPFCRAQVDYVARFTLEKEKYLLGEPIFCIFTLQNSGARTLTFSYRLPTRVLNPELQQEPNFKATDEAGHAVPDPAPRPCGGAKGSVVYGSVTLPPGQAHIERWLLNQWARFSHPGRYRARAERRLPLLAFDPGAQKFSERPAAYALAMNEFSFLIEVSTEDQLKRAFQPYLKILPDPKKPKFAEALLVVTTLPQPFLLENLEALVSSPTKEAGWDRKQVLEGLARLGTRQAWGMILKVARGEQPAGQPSRGRAASAEDESRRAYAVLLLAEKGDAAFLPPLLEIAASASEGLRGDVLRALGFFRDPRANQVLFEKLHSPNATDRVNAILGLKNLESRDAIPALLAMLNDPEARVRQVGNFALQSLTGQDFKLSSTAARAESARVAERWHAWWQAKGARFVPARQGPCRDW